MINKMYGKNKKENGIVEVNKANQCEILFSWERTVIEKTAINNMMSKTLGISLAYIPEREGKIIR